MGALTLTSLQAFTNCYRDSFTFLLNIKSDEVKDETDEHVAWIVEMLPEPKGKRLLEIHCSRLEGNIKVNLHYPIERQPLVGEVSANFCG
jgi:hypothetical protein